MVASTHWLASGAGMSILERGGNAFDAAAATAFALQVVEPHLNGMGGELTGLLWSGDHQRAEVLCGQGPAPAGASIERFSSLGLDAVPGTGLLAACVPGAFGAWTELVERYGRMEIGDVLEPAIAFARDGFPVSVKLHRSIARVADMFREHWPTSASLWLTNDGVPPTGSILRNPQLAETYSRLVQAGEGGRTREARIRQTHDAFYRGFVAEAIDAFGRTAEVMDSSGRPHGGLLTADDLAQFAPGFEAPISLDYAGVTVHKASTWTQGLVFLQQLAQLAHTDVAEVGRGSGRFAHLVVESAKLALADREAWYGDPAFVEVPIEGLLDPRYVAERARLIGDEASLELRPGAPGGRRPQLAPDLRVTPGAFGTGEPTMGESGQREPALALPPHGDTVHLDVADRWGNVVAVTTSGGWLQSSPAIPGLGFCLGTRAQMFWLTEGLPNSLAPGKRPRTTLTPTLATREGKPWLAFGTAGGDSQDQWSLVLLLTALHYEDDLQLAIDAPTFYTTHAPSSFYPRKREPGRVYIEGHADAEAVAFLRKHGHDVVVDEPWSQGWLSAVGQGPSAGWLRGAACARERQGYVVGR